jgi:hypothetical protein
VTATVLFVIATTLSSRFILHAVYPSLGVIGCVCPTFSHLGLTAHTGSPDNTISKMERKIPDNPEWKPVWDTILDLYLAPNGSLSKVKTAMESRGFRKTYL